MEILRTGRLRLRTVGPGDASFYLALLNDPAFIEHIGDRGVRTLEQARCAVLDGPVAMQRERGHSLYLVEMAGTGEAAGLCGLVKRETLEDVDLGYAFLPAYRGRGLAFEAARAVLDYAPGIGIARVAAITTPGNAASNGLLRKLGMRCERLVHLSDDDPGTNLYVYQHPRPPGR